MTMYILLLCFAGALAGEVEPCGDPPGCLCTVPILHSIVCVGNLTVFPFFPAHEKPGVLEIVLRNTRIVDLFPFDEEVWPRLKYLDVWANPLLPCSVISQLERPGLDVYSNCNATTELPPTESTPSNTWLLPLLSVILFLLVGISCILIYCNLKVRDVIITKVIKGVGS